METTEQTTESPSAQPCVVNTPPPHDQNLGKARSIVMLSFHTIHDEEHDEPTNKVFVSWAQAYTLYRTLIHRFEHERLLEMPVTLGEFDAKRAASKAVTVE